MLDKLRKDTENFTQDISKEYYLQGAGLKDNVNLETIYAQYPDLFTKENLELIRYKQFDEGITAEEKSRLNLLQESFIGELFNERVKTLQSEFLKQETNGKINLVGGKELSFRSSAIDLVNQTDRNKREIIRKAREKFTIENLNPILERIFLIESDFINELGYVNKVDMFQSLSGINLFKLRDEMRKFLNDTEDLYGDLLKRIVKEKLNMNLNEIKQHDIQHMLRIKEFDNLFPKDKMIKYIKSFTSKMGIDIMAGNNITFDLDARENKSPRAFCSPVKIPNEVYLVLYPRGGEDDYTTFLHELGHALHFANVSSSLDFEYKFYGDNSVTEGYAMSFDHLTKKKLWMQRTLGIDSKNNQNYFFIRYFKELLMLRRYAAKIDYEIQLNERPNLEGKPELYSEIFTKATKIQYTPVNYLYDVDPYFYCARYLRAWMFQSNFHECMVNKFDEGWFENKKAGDLLKDMWSVGQRYNADDLLFMNNCDKLSIKPLKDEIIKALSN